MPSYLWVILAIVTAIIGFFIGNYVREKKNAGKIHSAEALAKKILDDANHDAETRKKEAIFEAKDEIHRMRDEHEMQYQKRQNELQDMERRILRREDVIEQKTQQLEKQDAKLNKEMDRVRQRQNEAAQIVEQQKEELERISGLNEEQAKSIVLERTRSDVVHERAQILREEEARTREEAQSIAREIITRTVQRYSSDYVAESTVSVVSLPNDEMKGRIIGREGRNIRAFETMTGVDLIIDDTPQAVVLSCFDPVRREKARIALEKLIVDGRIHPTRIEELYKKAEQEVNASIHEAGELAVEQVGIRNMHPELINILGKMKYRTSYGQNALAHTIEVAQLAGMLAMEVGANVKIAKRGGLLHDLGKAVDHEIELPHVELGVRLAKKYKESKEVIHCIEAHHYDVEPTTLEAIIVQTADAISAARPGARRESMENYVKRLEDLEAIANSFDGIEQSFAIQAGREMRIIVKPEKVSEDQMVILAHDIAEKVEQELEYPGQIKINVIRETRATDIAK
ncbi:MAG: ribonuclease Y [Peptoniphilaceae bacterium]|nr:ribonuclease Y [Peptoniphilaceae bacterium]MDY5766698.1 ribonuclease Y [Peptoniphilaceae bacterium]MDY6145947.1 ribonuclease Y [Peptoniphilaceae bacterium]